MENGWPVLILDVEDLVRSIDNLIGGRRLRPTSTRPRATQAGAPSSRRSGSWSWTTRSPSASWSVSSWKSRGYQVDTAVDGLDGWNTVRAGTRYDLVVSDVDMPRMDGIQLVRSIKGDPRLKGVPVVIVSYKDREEDRIRGLDAGADSYLTKSSFHDQSFLDTVVDLIGEPTE